MLHLLPFSFVCFSPGAESRGGHIPGALTFPLSWLEGADDAKHLAGVLGQKGIHPDQTVSKPHSGKYVAASAPSSLGGLSSSLFVFVLYLPSFSSPPSCLAFRS